MFCSFSTWLLWLQHFLLCLAKQNFVGHPGSTDLKYCTVLQKQSKISWDILVLRTSSTVLQKQSKMHYWWVTCTFLLQRVKKCCRLLLVISDVYYTVLCAIDMRALEYFWVNCSKVCLHRIFCALRIWGEIWLCKFMHSKARMTWQFVSPVKNWRLSPVLYCTYLQLSTQKFINCFDSTIDGQLYNILVKVSLKDSSSLKITYSGP